MTSLFMSSLDTLTRDSFASQASDEMVFLDAEGGMATSKALQLWSAVLLLFCMGCVLCQLPPSARLLAVLLPMNCVTPQAAVRPSRPHGKTASETDPQWIRLGWLDG